MSTPSRAHWGLARSLLCLAPLLVAAPYFAYRASYALPEPVVDLINPATSLPQLSEAQILAHAKYLSEDIGYRTVGTREHAVGDAWMVQQAEDLRRQCEDAVSATPGRKLQCEVWRQQGSGSHRFDIMGKRLYKNYVNLSNIIVRVSDGTEQGKEHAVLVNSHLDSTLPSPGAADDALAVGVMIECIRVLVNTPHFEPAHAIVFLFNNAEESLQDASHLFATQHPLAKTVRAVINLEAAGTKGPELLFQATSEQMIQAYAHVPRPHGTVLANEIFSSGIMMSDTDFRQFELYLNVTGLDMAVVGNSYMYHTRKDLVEHIEPGVAQHMADNTLALLQYLSSSSSPLASLTSGYSRPDTVFFQYFSYFFIYSFGTARILYVALFVLSVGLVKWTFVDPAPALRQGRGVVREGARGLVAVTSAFVAAVVSANVVAGVMRGILGRPLSWFSSELLCLALYGPPALAGALASQLLIGRVREHSTFSSLLISQAFLACTIQLLGVGSAVIFFLSALSMFLALFVNALVTKPGDNLSLWTYAIGQFTPLTTGTQVICSVLVVFVPLTGRMGVEAPAEHIIASIVAITGSIALPLVVPFVHRFPRRTLARVVSLLSVMSVLAIAIFSMREPFDELHQKRLYVIHMENITSQEQHLHIATADSAPGFDILVHEIANEFSVPGVAPDLVVMNEWNGDWDTIYPFSAFLSPYKMALPLKPEYMNAPAHNFTVTAINDTFDKVAGTRSLTLKVTHPDIIWTAVAFDAHVLSWTLDDNPPDEYARHHIKEASFYGHDTWTVDLVMKLPEEGVSPTGKGIENGKLQVNFVGVHEKAMWPGKKAEKAEGGRAIKLLEDLDSWLEKEKGGKIDATLLGCVGGVAWV